jgi:predicted SprT family Zn-dependent metalloprotease
MAKEGNKSSGPKHEVKGPCTDCGTNDGSFVAVRRHTLKRTTMVRLCEKCAVKV